MKSGQKIRDSIGVIYIALGMDYRKNAVPVLLRGLDDRQKRNQEVGSGLIVPNGDWSHLDWWWYENRNVKQVIMK